jgi:hypothetical protein
MTHNLIVNAVIGEGNMRKGVRVMKKGVRIMRKGNVVMRAGEHGEGGGGTWG